MAIDLGVLGFFLLFRKTCKLWSNRFLRVSLDFFRFVAPPQLSVRILIASTRRTCHTFTTYTFITYTLKTVFYNSPQC